MAKIEHSAATDLAYLTMPAPGGWLAAAWDGGGIVALAWPAATRTLAMEELAECCPGTLARAGSCGALTTVFQRYFARAPVAWPQVNWSKFSQFQRRVLQQTCRIEYGRTASYDWVAHSIGQPGAARAVGQALKTNPIPLVIPCHRVISKNGSLGGYYPGVRWKQWLLALEANNYKHDG